MKPFARSLLIHTAALAICAATPGIAAAALDNAVDDFAQSESVEDKDLNTMRGGFALPNGIVVHFTYKSVYNGVTQTYFSSADLAKAIQADTKALVNNALANAGINKPKPEGDPLPFDPVSSSSEDDIVPPGLIGPLVVPPNGDGSVAPGPGVSEEPVADQFIQPIDEQLIPTHDFTVDPNPDIDQPPADITPPDNIPSDLTLTDLTIPTAKGIVPDNDPDTMEATHPAILPVDPPITINDVTPPPPDTTQGIPPVDTAQLQNQAAAAIIQNIAATIPNLSNVIQNSENNVQLTFEQTLDMTVSNTEIALHNQSVNQVLSQAAAMNALAIK